MLRNIGDKFWYYTPNILRDIYRNYTQLSPTPKPNEKTQSRINAEEEAKKRVPGRQTLPEQEILEFSLRPYLDIEQIRDFKSFSETIKNQFGQRLSSINLFSDYNLRVLNAICLRIQSALEGLPYTTKEWEKIEKIHQYQSKTEEEKELKDSKKALKRFRVVTEYNKYTEVAKQLDGNIFDTLRKNIVEGNKINSINELQKTWQRRRKFATLKSESLKELSYMLDMLENYLRMLTGEFQLPTTNLYKQLFRQLFGVDTPVINSDDKERIGYYVSDMADLIAKMRQDLSQAMYERIVIAHKEKNHPSGKEEYCEDVVYDTLESLVEIEPALKSRIEKYKTQASPRRTLSKDMMNEFYAFINEYGTNELKQEIVKYEAKDFIKSAIFVDSDKIATTSFEDPKIDDIDNIIKKIQEDFKTLEEKQLTETQMELTASLLGNSFVFVQEDFEAEHQQTEIQDNLTTSQLYKSFVFVPKVLDPKQQPTETTKEPKTTSLYRSFVFVPEEGESEELIEDLSASLLQPAELTTSLQDSNFIKERDERDEIKRGKENDKTEKKILKQRNHRNAEKANITPVLSSETLGVTNPLNYRDDGYSSLSVNILTKEELLKILNKAEDVLSQTDIPKSKIIKAIKTDMQNSIPRDTAIQNRINDYLGSNRQDAISLLIQAIEKRINTLQPNKERFFYTSPRAKVIALKMLQEHLILFDLGIAKENNENLISKVIENWLNSAVVTSTKNGVRLYHTAEEILGEQRFVFSCRKHGDTKSLDFIYSLLEDTIKTETGKENEKENKHVIRQGLRKIKNNKL